MMALRSLGISVAILLAGCGGRTTSADEATNGTTVRAPVVEGELFVRNTNGRLELVRVDLATGRQAPVAEPLPLGASMSSYPTFRQANDGERVVVGVPTSGGAETFFALDRGTDGSTTWRKIEGRMSFSSASSDLSILTYLTAETPGRYDLHIVRYSGEVVATVVGAEDPSRMNVYPQVASISPEGRFVVVRPSLNALSAYAIPESGPAIGPATPPTDAELAFVCALPSTFMLSTLGADSQTLWVEPSFLPVGVDGFRSSRHSEIVKRHGTGNCAFRVDDDDDRTRTVSFIDDRASTMGFRYDSELGRLVDANGDRFVALDSRSTGSKITFGSAASTRAIATYRPLAPSRGAPPPNRTIEQSLEEIALEHSSQRLAMVVRVRTDTRDVAGPTSFSTPFEESNELWVVENGRPKEIVRLTAGDPSTVPRGVWFSADGKHVYWGTNETSELRIKVHGIDTNAERILDGRLTPVNRYPF